MRGQIKKRGSRYQLRVYLGEEGGKRVYRSKTVDGPKKAAAEALTAWVAEINQGGYVSPAKRTFGQLLDRWFDEWVPFNVGPTTAQRYKSAADGHLRPALGPRPLAKLTLEDFNSLYAKASKAGLKPATVATIHSVAHNALGAAVRWKWLGRNPADKADVPRQGRRAERVVLNPAQAVRLIETARGSFLFAAVVLTLTLGLRIGELIALKWADLDLDAGTLGVRRTRIRTIIAGVDTGPPKTDASARTNEFGPDLAAVLRRHRAVVAGLRLKAGPAWRDNDLVFPGRTGAMRDPAALNRHLGRLLARAGLPAMTWHGLRHSAATIRLTDGEHLKLTQTMLGHATLKETADLYQHVTTGLQRGASGKVERRLLGKSALRARPAHMGE